MGPDEHLAAVLAAEADGQDGDFLFFWGHQPRPDGTIGPSCLSQWWPASFSVDGIAYPHGRALDDGRQGPAVRP